MLLQYHLYQTLSLTGHASRIAHGARGAGNGAPRDVDNARRPERYQNGNPADTRRIHRNGGATIRARLASLSMSPMGSLALEDSCARSAGIGFCAIWVCISSSSSSAYYKITNFLRPEIKIVYTNYMPEVVSDLSYDFKDMFESFPQELGWAS
jgi:hypothetical protein